MYVRFLRFFFQAKRSRRCRTFSLGVKTSPRWTGNAFYSTPAEGGQIARVFRERFVIAYKELSSPLRLFPSDTGLLERLVKCLSDITRDARAKQFSVLYRRAKLACNYHHVPPLARRSDHLATSQRYYKGHLLEHCFGRNRLQLQHGLRSGRPSTHTTRLLSLFSPTSREAHRLCKDFTRTYSVGELDHTLRELIKNMVLI